MEISKHQSSICHHEQITSDSGYFVCVGCGLTFDHDLVFENQPSFNFKNEEYQRKVNALESKTRSQVSSLEGFNRIIKTDKWFRDYSQSFKDQKAILVLLENYGFYVSAIDIKSIKDAYFRLLKKKSYAYENMTIHFLTLVWIHIRDKTTRRIEEYIESCQHLGHKISRKMLNATLMKIVNKSASPSPKYISEGDLESEIKSKIKVFLEQNLNGLLSDRKLRMRVMMHGISLLNALSYNDLYRFSNYKCFAVGLTYYLGQCFPEHKMLFKQSILEETTSFSSTTIRKHFNELKKILGMPLPHE